MRLLLIGNSIPTSWIVKLCLERGGFTVDTATEENADDRVRTNSYDILVLNLPLTRLDGRTLLQGWRKSGLKVPVLVLTAVDNMADRVAMLDIGADGLLTKPFHEEELLARLRALLRRRLPTINPVQRVFDLEFNPDARTVRRGGHDIRLTPREFALLQLLADHRGKVVSRSMILKHLYDDHNENNSNVVDVFIRYLRTKIDKGFDLRLILTRWGEGYLLRGDSI